MTWQAIAAASIAALIAMLALGPWPFVVLCATLAFLAAFARGGKLRASFSFFGVKAEIEGEKPISTAALIEPDMPSKLIGLGRDSPVDHGLR